jgi:DUF971 family protein
MRLADIQAIGDELAIRWDDGSECFIPLETMRRGCPCAGCKGETDIMGNVYKAPEKPLSLKSHQLMKIELVGSYAIQPVWADGHSAGIYSFKYLQKLAKSI